MLNNYVDYSQTRKLSVNDDDDDDDEGRINFSMALSPKTTVKRNNKPKQ